MEINNKYELGDIVYLKTDEDQKQRMVTGLRVFGKNNILYCLSCGTIETNHYYFEISDSKNFVLSTSN